MNAFLLGARTVRRQPLPALLTVLLLALGIATVVGAKGSGLQLVLSAVFSRRRADRQRPSPGAARHRPPSDGGDAIWWSRQ